MAAISESVTMTQNNDEPDVPSCSYINIAQREHESIINEDDVHGNQGIHDKQENRLVRLRQGQVGTAFGDYMAREKEELSIKHGSVVEIIKEECGKGGWILAKVENKQGIVPKDYVVLVGSQPSLVRPEKVRKLDKFLGSGGFADVHLGVYRDERVALKKPRSNCEKGKEILKREALILSRLDHPNIVKFLGLSIDPLFIVLELCEGGTLFRLGRKMYSSDILTVIYWAIQVGEAIEHLHYRKDPLVYADLKAENVLIKQKPCECELEDENGAWRNKANYLESGECRKCHCLRINRITLKLADFNVTRGLSMKRDSCTGSLPWMSPEMIQNSDLSKGSDIWSFGMFLWEICSRKLPFNDLEIGDIIATIINKPEPLQLPKDLPHELRIVFEQCWRKNPEERPSITVILEHLRHAKMIVKNNYQWLLKDEPKRESLTESEVIDYMSRDLSIIVPYYEALMVIERLGMDKNKMSGFLDILKKNMQPKTKNEKQLPPQTRAKWANKNTKLGKDIIGSPQDFRHNVSVFRESNTHFNNAISRHSQEKLVIRCKEGQVSKPMHHRSHESLLDYGNGDSSYSTFPRNLRLHKKSPPVYQRAHNNYLRLGSCACISALGLHHNKIKKSERNLSALMTNETKELKNKAEWAEMNSNEINLFGSSEGNDSANKTLMEERKLSRAYAFRHKLTEQQPQPSSCSSPSLDDFEVVGGDCEDIPSIAEERESSKQSDIRNLFNRQISPPKLHIANSQGFTKNSSADLEEMQKQTTLKRKRIDSSVFYLPLPSDSEEKPVDYTSQFETSHQHSMKLMNRFRGTSPPHSSNDDVVIEQARCVHPNHNRAHHLCALRTASDELASDIICLSRVLELNQIALENLSQFNHSKLEHQRCYKKRTEDSSPRHRFDSMFANKVKGINKSPTESQGQRLSINTVIHMHGEDKSPVANVIRINQRSCNDLSSIKNEFPHLTKNSPTLLSANQLSAVCHQRSRSTDNQQSKPSVCDLFEKLLQPLPADGTIVNPSYIPMNSDQQKSPNMELEKNLTGPSETKWTPIPLPRASFTGTFTNRGSSSQSLDRPPTSKAPILDRSTLEANMLTSANVQIPRPSTLQIAPPALHSSPLTTPTTSNSIFTNSNASLGIVVQAPVPPSQCDSGIDHGAATEDENSPQQGTHTTIFSTDPNTSPMCLAMSNRRKERMPPPLPSTPPPRLSQAPPLHPRMSNPASAASDSPRVPPIPRNIFVTKSKPK